MEKIWEVVGVPGDMLNKARFFDNDIKTKGQPSAAKIIPILVNFSMKMEATLVEIQKLISGSPTGSSQAPPPPPKETPWKEKSPGEVKTLLLQKQVKDLVVGMAKIEVPPTVELPTTSPAEVKTKKARRDSETPTSEPSSQKRSVKKN